MIRRQRTIRGIDEDAWQMLSDVREVSRTHTGALISSAIRFWYDQLPEEGQLLDEHDRDQNEEVSMPSRLA